MPTRPATSLMRSARAGAPFRDSRATATRFADARFGDAFDEFFLLDTTPGFLLSLLDYSKVREAQQPRRISTQKKFFEGTGVGHMKLDRVSVAVTGSSVRTSFPFFLSSVLLLLATLLAAAPHAAAQSTGGRIR